MIIHKGVNNTQLTGSHHVKHVASDFFKKCLFNDLFETSRRQASTCKYKSVGRRKGKEEVFEDIHKTHKKPNSDWFKGLQVQKWNYHFVR